MAQQQFELMAAGTVLNANGNTVDYEVETVSMLAVSCDVTAVSGTTPQLDLWLQGKDESGKYVDVPADLVLKSADAAAAGTTNANVRDIIDAHTSGAASWVAVFKHFPFRRFRLKWKVSGTTPSFTLSAAAAGK